MDSRPNVLFVFADQWRAQATGYNGDPNCRTPSVDGLAAESISLVNAVAGCPVCSPYRGSLMTGQQPLNHGIIVNDVGITSDAVPVAECFDRAGYDTAYIGKWHIDGHGRSAFVPIERRLGFRYWRGFECTHDYDASFHYADDPRQLLWDGYDAQAQTRHACEWLREHNSERPFMMMLSWGPPHAPYDTAPEEFRALYRAEDIFLSPNVPDEVAKAAREQLAGYYAHIAALDGCVGDLLQALAETGLDENTIVVLTSDHGDMLGSQGMWKKQSPWDESLRVPFLLRWPSAFGRQGRAVETPFNAPDIMPTLLGLCDLDIPDSVDGVDASPVMYGQPVPELDGALLAMYFPFHQWRPALGGREYRGVRNGSYTYVRDLDGPWLLFDNAQDPYQLQNCCAAAAYADVRAELDALLDRKLAEIGDEFLPGTVLLERRGVPLDEKGDIRIRW